MAKVGAMWPLFFTQEQVRKGVIRPSVCMSFVCLGQYL